MYHPSFEEFCQEAARGNIIPIYREILGDMFTPVSAFVRLGDGKYSYLLESVVGGEKWARYSFIGINPSTVIKGKDREVEIVRDGVSTKTYFNRDPLEVLKKEIDRYIPIEVDGLPRFFGGAVGYIGYDVVRFFEELPYREKDGLDLPDFFFGITDTIVIFDSLTQKIKVVSNAYIEGKGLREAYNEAIDKIDGIIRKLRGENYGSRFTVLSSRLSTLDSRLSSNFTRDAFKEAVLRAKEYIKAGDIFQVVLSQRFERDISASPFDVYRALRVINPSPYMYFLRMGEAVLVGSSPEILVRLEGSTVTVRPIAGTRRRGRTEKEDMALENELKADPKENAEHIMLVDLGRNDVGRVSVMGSVKVTELMGVERYSHVMHLVSNVEGILDNGNDTYDVMRACFPAGTVSGAPKIRAMEIIEELEPTRRGPYAGAVGYISFSGNMDTCITIRTILINDGKAYIQAGAGIVADSDPEREYIETVNKAKGMMKAIEMAEEGLS
ncbi:MAG: anthranilate synthase component I [Nitrospirota bacterium]